MSSPSAFPSYLDPSDLAMLERVLTKVSGSRVSGVHRFQYRRRAQLLIRKFQAGMTKESDLLAAITNGSKLVHVDLAVDVIERLDRLAERDDASRESKAREMLETVVLAERSLG